MAKLAAVDREDNALKFPDSLGTRERLLLTAERLIAEEGVGQVSMRRINADAGARNLSAVHYHFGSLEGVIAAIFEYRMGPVDRRRREMLDELFAEQRKPQASELLHAVVWPLAEQMLDHAGPNYYVRFLAAVNRTPSLDTWSVVPHGSRRGLVRSYVALRRLLASVPRDVLHTRMMLALRGMIYALADVDQMITSRHPASRNALVMFHASDLVTRLESSLVAPVSEATRMARRVLEASAACEAAPLFGMDAMWALGRARPSAA